jgi:hypothetical protein
VIDVFGILDFWLASRSIALVTQEKISAKMVVINKAKSKCYNEGEIKWPKNVGFFA